MYVFESIQVGPIHWFVVANGCCSYNNMYIGSVALLSHFDKVFAFSKFALLMCENEVNPIARIPWATSTAQKKLSPKIAL